MDKYTAKELKRLPTAAELRSALRATENSEAREQLRALFDDSTFIETGAYVKRTFSDFVSVNDRDDFEGVVTGYGAIDGKLVYAFAEDASRMKGVIDDRHAKKIADLYTLALRNGAPVVGLFNSVGTDVFEGATSLAAYARIMKCVTDASGVVPQVAIVTGKCIGTAAAIASMFDFTLRLDTAEFYVTSPDKTGVKNAQDDAVAYIGNEAAVFGFARSLVSFLPENASVESVSEECNDNLGRMLGDLDFAGSAPSMIASVADNGVFLEVGAQNAKSVTTAFATVGGVRTGIVANSFAENEGRIDAAAAKKIAKFVNFLDSFNVPVVTLVDSMGLSADKDNDKGYASALSEVAFAYAGASVAKVTVLTGHAIGAAFALLGAKATGADVVYALDSAEIGTLPAESGVAFAWDSFISADKSREELVSEWKTEVSSPVAAASTGEVDDIIGVTELRARICSALLMLADKAKYTKILSI